jgi:hypothetical protein
MKLVVITPVGPGHEKIVQRAIESVKVARRFVNPGTYERVHHEVVYDTQGEMGRCKARNIGIDAHPDADWYFFLDADDYMRNYALTRCDHTFAATFGAVSLCGKVTSSNLRRCGWAEIAKYGALGTLSMGFFCRGDVARELKFREDMDAGEDFEFYLRLPGFRKVKDPLVDIGRDTPSAVGPRGYTSLDWIGTCNKIIAEAIARDPQKFNLHCDAVLAPGRNPVRVSRALQRTLRRRET